MPVHEIHALANGFGAFHARQASPKSPQVNLQNIFLVVFQCCTAWQGVSKYSRRQTKKKENAMLKTLNAANMSWV